MRAVVIPISLALGIVTLSYFTRDQNVLALAAIALILMGSSIHRFAPK